MKTKMTLTLMTLALTLTFSGVSGMNCKGCTPLDEITFDKMLKNFPVSVVKFDTAYPYGDKHEEFAKVALDGSKMDDLLVGEVGIKDYGDKDNEALGKRFGIEKDDFPVMMVFVRDPETKKVTEHKFAGDFKVASLKSFIRQKSGVYLPLPGCLEPFDKLADKLMKATSDKEKAAVIKEAEAEKAKTPEATANAEMYVKVMKKVAKDDAFIAKEIARVKKLVKSGSLTKAKKDELGEKVNVLRSFLREGEKVEGDDEVEEKKEETEEDDEDEGKDEL